MDSSVSRGAPGSSGMLGTLMQDTWLRQHRACSGFFEPLLTSARSAAQYLRLTISLFGVSGFKGSSHMARIALLQSPDGATMYTRLGWIAFKRARQFPQTSPTEWKEKR